MWQHGRDYTALLQHIVERLVPQVDRIHSVEMNVICASLEAPQAILDRPAAKHAQALPASYLQEQMALAVSRRAAGKSPAAVRALLESAISAHH